MFDKKHRRISGELANHMNSLSFVTNSICLIKLGIALHKPSNIPKMRCRTTGICKFYINGKITLKRIITTIAKKTQACIKLTETD